MYTETQRQLEIWIADLAQDLKSVEDPPVRAPGTPCGSHFSTIREWWEAVARGLALEMEIPANTRYQVIREAVARRLRSRAA